MPDFQIHYGAFRSGVKRRPLAHPVPGLPTYVNVRESEEKGSDVNLATRLLVDGFNGEYEQAVVVSNDVACRFDAVVQVVPVTTLPARELRPYESRCGSAASGLAKPSRAVANQIRTVSRNRIGQTIGRLTPGETVELDRALRIQLALDE